MFTLSLSISVSVAPLCCACVRPFSKMSVVDRIASVFGIVSFPNSLVQSVKAIWDYVHRYLHNDQRNGELQALAEELMKTVSAPAYHESSSLADHVKRELESVKLQLPQIKKRSMRMLSAHREHGELNEVERKLDGLKSDIETWRINLDDVVSTAVTAVCSDKRVASTVCNDRVELPPSDVGINRGEKILDFLQRSVGKDLRVIGIYGLPGVGKTTLLNYVWKKVSAKVPLQFIARAYVQIGDHATDSTIRGLQTSILRQLGGDNKEFPSDDFARAELNKHFQQLKTDGKPFFLAIDNVFEKKDLERLLPFKLLSGNLPTSSCVTVTCRNYSIVKALVINICGLRMSDDQVYAYEPPCLNHEESQRLFADCAGMQDASDSTKHQELLNALVPLCGGLPLALTVLGSIFTDEFRRQKKQWKLTERQWADLDDPEDEHTSRVIKALHLIFDSLGASRQIAFLDMVSTFYGWPWESVERIVNENVMRDLLNSTLVRKVDGIDKCNQSALRWGYNYWRSLGHSHVEEPSRVSMHDLTLRFGKSILEANKLDYKQYVKPPVEDLQLSKLRHLIMSDYDDDNVQELLQNATGLRMLTLLKDKINKTGLPRLQASSCGNEISSSKQQLHHLRVEGGKWSTSILEMKVFHELRELNLDGCSDLVQLPINAPLSNLEVLRIINCPKFEGFSASSVKEWRFLQDLFVENCNNITVLPEDLGSLPSLRDICITSCSNLESFPSLRNPNGPSSLTIGSCFRLHTLGDMLCPLKSLKLSLLSKIRKLPVGIFKASPLETLCIENCRMLVELLPEGEITYNMTSLSELKIKECDGLRRLPAGIFQESLKSLIVLELWLCSELVELPNEIGSLHSLKTLNLGFCSKLVDLPNEIGSLRSLETLDLRFCRKLEKLPDSIVGITSLKKLNLDGCQSLKKLPPKIGCLCSLRTLILSRCTKLERLPDSITSMTSLETLHLDGCESLKQLPIQVGGLLCPLKKLIVGGCEKLENLPDLLSSSIGSLEELQLVGYDDQSLANQLPPQIMIGLCSNLKRLSLWRCRKLEKLPDFLIRITSLEDLDLRYCESLTELPQQIGGLCSLKRMSLVACKQLVKLPDSIATITSLEVLSLSDCESLTELPQEMGGLCSLKKFSVVNCDKLEKLPDSIATITSLEALNLCNCKSLTEIPQGGLCSTAVCELRVEGCDKLESFRTATSPASRYSSFRLATTPRIDF